MDNLSKWIKYQNTLLEESDYNIYEYEETLDIETIEIENDLEAIYNLLLLEY